MSIIDKLTDNDFKRRINGYFVLRCVCLFLATLGASWLIYTLNNELYRVIVFGLSVIFYLFTFGELNVKPITASASLEIKK